MGFLYSDLETNIESDLITGPFLADFYAGPVTIQLAPVASVFYGDEKQYGGHARVIASFDAVDLSANYKIVAKESESTSETILNLSSEVLLNWFNKPVDHSSSSTEVFLRR